MTADEAAGAEPISNDAQLEFLFEKWRHHDTLMHSRAGVFWNVQLALASLMVLLTQFGEATAVSFAVAGSVLIAFGLVGRNVRTTMQVDRICRNAFNQELVGLLERESDLLARYKIPAGLLTSEFSPEAVTSPLNKWHGPPERTHKTVVSTMSLEQFILIATSLQIAGGLAGLAYAGISALGGLNGLAELMPNLGERS